MCPYIRLFNNSAQIFHEKGAKPAECCTDLPHCLKMYIKVFLFVYYDIRMFMPAIESEVKKLPYISGVSIVLNWSVLFFECLLLAYFEILICDQSYTVVRDYIV